MATPLEHPPVAPSSASRSLAFTAVLILLPALGVRLGWPNSISFGGEQIDSIALAWRAWHEGLPERGLRVSVGVDMPPLFVWFLMLPVALTRDPILVTGAFALANLAGLWILGLALRRPFGTRVAWMTVLLLAAAPWPVLFSRKIWAQDLILPFHALFLWTLVRWLEQRTRGRAIAAIVALGLLFQVYPGTWFLALAIVAWMVAFRVRIPWRDVLIGGVVALVPYASWIHYQFASGFDGFRLALTQRGGEPLDPGVASWSHHPLDLVLLPFQLAGGSSLDLAIGRDAYGAFGESLTTPVLLGLQSVVCVLTGLAFVVVAAMSLRSVVRNRGVTSSMGTLILGLCVFEVLVVAGQFLVFQSIAAPHYLIVLVLPVAVVFAWALDRGSERVRGAGSSLGLGIACAIASLHAATTASLFEFMRTRTEKIFQVYDVPYGHARARLDLELALEIEDALHGDERRRAESRALEPIFESAAEVLLRLDPKQPSSTFTGLRGLEQSPGEYGVEWKTVGPQTWCELAPFQIPARKALVLRLDLSVPVDTMMHLFFQTESQPNWRRDQLVELPLRAGRTVQMVRLDAEDLRPDMGFRIGAHRATIHALEIRALDR